MYIAGVELFNGYDVNIKYEDDVHRTLCDIDKYELLLVNQPNDCLGLLGIAGIGLAENQIVEYIPGKNTEDVMTYGGGADPRGVMWSWSINAIDSEGTDNATT